MNKKYVEFICNLHGYLIRVKEIHWNAAKNSIHKLCDEIEDDIAECEDRFAECAMGMEGVKFEIGHLKPMLPKAKDLESMLYELEGDVVEMKKSCELPHEGGLTNILDDMLEMCNKYKYRATQL